MLAKKYLERIKQYEMTQTDRCRTGSVPDGAYFAGITASEGPARRPLSADAIPRPVDVIVKRSGRVALYLAMLGGPVRWRVIHGPETEIAAVFLGSVRTGQAGDRV